MRHIESGSATVGSVMLPMVWLLASLLLWVALSTSSVVQRLRGLAQYQHQIQAHIRVENGWQCLWQTWQQDAATIGVLLPSCLPPPIAVSQHRDTWVRRTAQTPGRATYTAVFRYAYSTGCIQLIQQWGAITTASHPALHQPWRGPRRWQACSAEATAS